MDSISEYRGSRAQCHQPTNCIHTKNIVLSSHSGLEIVFVLFGLIIEMQFFLPEMMGDWRQFK